MSSNIFQWIKRLEQLGGNLTWWRPARPMSSGRETREDQHFCKISGCHWKVSKNIVLFFKWADGRSQCPLYTTLGFFWLDMIISNDTVSVPMLEKVWASSRGLSKTPRIESDDSDLKEFFGQNGVPRDHLAPISVDIEKSMCLDFASLSSQKNCRFFPHEIWFPQVFLTAGIIVADVVGAGILAMPAAVANFGLLPGSIAKLGSRKEVEIAGVWAMLFLGWNGWVWFWK